ncbi:MAG: hypothetical protein MUE81_04415 [Thermoflexibacter sp.]|jgi:hypothetical protein|nr:hypothetical protein [Thermoflexibacter sp.]
MPKYILYKKAFYYDGEYYDSHCEMEDGTTPRGRSLAMFSTIEEAQKARREADIEVITVFEDNIISFIPLGKGWATTIERLSTFFKFEFPDLHIHLTTENWETELDLLPDEMSCKQVIEMLDIMQLSFHDIYEYPDEEELNIKHFRLTSRDFQEFPPIISPPKKLDQASVKMYVYLDARHHKSEQCRHFVDGELITSVAALSICQYDEDEVYLFHCTEDWEVITDDKFSTVQEALEQAKAMYQGLKNEDWTEYESQ